METVETLHMNKGVDETSYAMNSFLQVHTYLLKIQKNYSRYVVGFKWFNKLRQIFRENTSSNSNKSNYSPNSRLSWLLIPKNQMIKTKNCL